MRLAEAFREGTLEDARQRAKPGFFRLRERRRGPFIAARIFWSVAHDPITGERLDRSPILFADINDQEADPGRVWLWGTPIEEDEYQWIRALTAIRHRKPRT